MCGNYAALFVVVAAVVGVGVALIVDVAAVGVDCVAQIVDVAAVGFLLSSTSVCVRMWQISAW